MTSDRGERRLKVRVKDKRKTQSSRKWLERQLNDPYVARAKREGYRSRAAFKLIEIDDKHHLFKSGGRHKYSFPDYDKMVAAGDAESDWNKRLDDYAKAEQVLIDNGALVPLVHPVTIAAVSGKLSGDGIKANSKGFTPLDRLTLFLYTHITKQ